MAEKNNIVFDYLKDHEEHKLKSLENARFHQFLSDSVKERVSNCGTYLSFDKWQNKKDTKELKHTLKSANFCKHRFCVMCAWRRAKRLQLQTYATIEHLEKLNKKKYQFLFLTLTVPNCQMPQLKDTIKKMSRAFSNLTKRKEWQKGIKGFIRGIEYTGDNTPEGEAHPHFHCLLMVDPYYFRGRTYINFEKWRRMWCECYGVDDLQVRVEKIKAKEGKTALLSAVTEVLKYSTDLTELNKLTDKDMAELLIQTSGIRQYNRGGLLKNLVEDFDNIDPQLWEYLGEEFYVWCKSFYRLHIPKDDDHLDD